MLRLFALGFIDLSAALGVFVVRFFHNTLFQGIIITMIIIVVIFRTNYWNSCLLHMKYELGEAGI